MSLIAASASPFRLVMLMMEDVELRAMTALALEFAGFRVVAIASPVDAKRYDVAAPHVVVVDLPHGDADDWEWVQALCDGGSSADTRLVFVADSAKGLPQLLETCCAAIVLRPVEPAAMVKITVDVAAGPGRAP